MNPAVKAEERGFFVRQALVILLVILWSATPGGAASTRETLDQAAAAYDAARCPEVLRLYQSIPAAALGEVDGIAHYRWAFCLAQARAEGFFDHYKQSADLLARQTEAKDASLEAWFYRVNALLNLQMPAEASTVARQALAQWQAGALTVPEKDPQSWFRLGKLFRDGGEGSGALEPFRRAVDLATQTPGSLRAPYLERIADHAAQQGDNALASRANALLGKAAPAAAGDQRQGRALLAEGKLAPARDWFASRSTGPSDEAMFNQYAVGAIDRTLELSAWNLDPNPVNPDGSPVANLREGLLGAAQEAWKTLTQCRVLEVPRKKGPGTRPDIDPDCRKAYGPVQARFAGLILRAVAAGELVREWAVEGGYAPLIIRPWEKLVLDRVAPERNNQLITEKEP